MTRELLTKISFAMVLVVPLCLLAIGCETRHSIAVDKAYSDMKSADQLKRIALAVSQYIDTENDIEISKLPLNWRTKILMNNAPASEASPDKIGWDDFASPKRAVKPDDRITSIFLIPFRDSATKLTPHDQSIEYDSNTLYILVDAPTLREQIDAASQFSLEDVVSDVLNSGDTLVADLLGNVWRIDERANGVLPNSLIQQRSGGQPTDGAIHSPLP